jgi:general secretion pathway protein G
MNTRKDRGFTLVEIMVVVVILGMLATLVLPNLLGSQEVAQQKKAITDLQQIHKAGELYYLQNPGKIPTIEDLIREDENGQAFLPGYENAPQDPWGNPYEIFQLQGTRNFAVFSRGPDGTEDTDDDLRSDKKK